MPRDIRFSLSRIDALLSRLDPQPSGTCTVPGCVHDHADAPEPVVRLERRPPTIRRGRHPVTPQAA